jgi:hypothetical protein
MTTKTVEKYSRTDKRLLATVPGFSGGEVYCLLTTNSYNRKLGDMFQVWIIPTTGPFPENQIANCWDCPLTPKASGGNGGCYVPRIPLYGLWRQLENKEIPSWQGDTELFRGRKVRFGAWGDPVLVPLAIVERIVGASSGHTGYTHFWRLPQFQPYRKYFMASVHSAQEAQLAHSMGWRFYLVSRKPVLQAELPMKTITCPNEKTGVTCERCPVPCDGAGGKMRLVSISASPHGNTAVTRSKAWQGGEHDAR